MGQKILVLILGLFISVAGHAAKYKLDQAHMSVSFKIKHLVIATVNGRFDKFEGSFDFDPKKGKLSKLEAKVDVDSINTNESDRDKHLRSADFFGTRNKKGEIVKKKRYMVFKGTKVEHKNKKPTKVHGKLTLNGKTKKVALNIDYKGAVTDPWGNKKVVFEATTTINRKDFGLTWNKKLDKGGLMIGEEVKVSIEGEANAK